MAAVKIDMTTGATTIQFNTGAGDPRYLCQMLDGWGEGAVRLSTMEIVGADGLVVTEARKDARTIVLAGTCWATTRALCWTAWNTIIAAFDCVTANGTLTVHETSNKAVTVRRRSDLKMAWAGPSHFQWQTTLIAATPTKV